MSDITTGAALREIRQRAGLTQADLAERMKRSRSLVAQIESGRARVTDRYRAVVDGLREEASDIAETALRPPASVRRERIATAVLQGIAASARTFYDAAGPVLDGYAERAVQWADALIAELDK